MTIHVSDEMLEAGFKKLESFTSMVDWAPRDQVKRALGEIYATMYLIGNPASQLKTVAEPHRDTAATEDSGDDA